jgi:hypothetical protein
MASLPKNDAGGNRPERSWQEIVADVGQVRSPERLAELSKELERALDKRKKASQSTLEAYMRIGSKPR